MIPYREDFVRLKEIALRCRSKKVGYGRMLNTSFRLWYDKDHETVNLYERYDQTLIAKMHPNNSVLFMIPDKGYIESIIKVAIHNIYGVRLFRIKGNKGISQHYSHFIENVNYVTDIDGKREILHPGAFVYIPEHTYLNSSGVIQASNYRESTIESKWSKNYTLVSKRNRAAFTAMNNMVPFEPIPKVGTVKEAIEHATTFNSSEAVDLVIRTPRPDGDDIYKIRKLLDIRNKHYTLRTNLQHFFNDQRYDRAQLDGKIEYHTRQNLPRGINKK